MRVCSLFASFLLLAAACGKTSDTDDATAGADSAADVTSTDGSTDTVPTPADPDCNPIVGNDCWSGWPSNFWLKSDATTKTGRRIDLPAALMPVNAAGTRVDVAEWNRRDGFSPNTNIVALLPTPPDPKLLPDETRPALTFTSDLPIVLLDAKTGAFVPFLAELDLNASDPARQALLIRQWTPVAPGTRLVVALTTKLLDAKGQPYPRTPTFQRLIDGKQTGYPRIDTQWQDWQDDLTALEKAGVTREHLVAAWHLDTASSDWTWGQALAMRETLLAAVGDNGLTYGLDQIEVDESVAAQLPNLPTPTSDPRVKITKMHPDVAVRLRGWFEAPLFLTTAEASGTLHWDDTGAHVTQNGTVKRPFVMLIPPNVLASKKSARLMLYGHGFLRGACVEGCVIPGDAEFFPHFVHAAGVIAVGTDWWGLAKTELALAVDAGSDFSHLNLITDKLAVGALMPIALTRVVLGKVAQDPILQFDTDQHPAIDTQAPLVYYGNSLGGIMGTTMTSLHPDLTRMVMNVAGGGWSTILNRSSDFTPFLNIINGVYTDRFVQQVLFAMSQSMWDLSDPLNFAQHVVTNPFPGTQPGRTALWPISMGDSQVANLTSGVLNRAAQVPLQTPAFDVWALAATVTTLPTPANVTVQWDSDRGTHPPGNGAREVDNLSHYATRWMPEFEQMVWRFLFGDGLVEPRYCLAGGRDDDGKLPCKLHEVVPTVYKDAPPLPVIPPPAIP